MRAHLICFPFNNPSLIVADVPENRPSGGPVLPLTGFSAFPIGSRPEGRIIGGPGASFQLTKRRRRRTSTLIVIAMAI